MTANIPLRAATSPELAKFRAGGQFSVLNLAIHDPGSMYNARVNQTFDSLDGVAEFIYDGGSGTLTNVKPGMTVFVSAVAFGQREKGITRVRKEPTADTFYIAETSDIQFADNDYITVFDAFALWPRDITETSGVVRMDYDIEFGSTLNGGVIPRVGPIVSVLNMTGASVTFTPPSPALSASYDGTTIDSYLYEATGAATTTNMDTSSPSWTYDAEGQYRWSCSMTDSNGRVTTAYRWVFVNPPSVDFTLDTAVVGDYDSGDWSFTVTLFENATKVDIYERAMITLYATDYYEGTQQSIGKLEGYENILCVGWVDGESISWDSEKGSVTFTVRGPAFWLDKMRAFPFEIQDTASAPANWKQINEMTVDKALAHILFWTTTAPTIMDIFFTGDTTRVKVLAQPGGSLLNQINAIAAHTLFAKALVNNLGQMFIEIDQQLIPYADRASITTVMDITTADYIPPIDIERNTTTKTSMVEFSAYQEYNGVSQRQVYSRAPGRIGKLHGGISSFSNYVIADQDEANRMSGALLAMENYEYSAFDLDMGANNRLIDIAPRQYCTMTIAEADNPRGIALSAARLIPRKVVYNYDAESGALTTSGVFEVETIGVDGVSYYPIDIGEDDTPIDIGDIDDFPIDDIDFPDDPIDVGTPCADGVSNHFSLSWDITELRGEDSTKLSAKAYFPCMIRADGSVYETSLNLPGTWFGDAPTHYNVYGILGGSRVITGTVTHNKGGNVAQFNPLSDTQVDGFEVLLEAGLGSDLEYVVEDIVETGTVAATNDTFLLSTAVTVGNYYSLNAWGGPWKKESTWPNEYDFIAGCGAQITGSTGIGLASTSSSTTAFHLDVGTLGIEAYALNSLYGLVIFQATDTAVGFVVADTVKSDNIGSLGYTLRNVTANGRRILLGGAVLHNVCAIE